MKIHNFIFSVLVAFILAMPAYAQSNSKAIPQTVEELKAMSNNTPRPTYEKIKSLRVPAVKHRVVVEEKTIRVSPGESKTVALSRDAASVIVANPAHATVFLDNPRLLVIMPRAPGATELMVLDSKGKTILQKGVLVSGSGDDHVRIRRICNDSVTDCQAQTIYYCPDNNCAEVAIQEPDTSGTYPSVPASVSPRGDTSDSNDTSDTSVDPDESVGSNN